MKCVCGYEYRKDEHGWDKDDTWVLLPDVGDDPFRLCRTPLVFKGENYWDGDISVYPWMCPKCGTLKVEQ